MLGDKREWIRDAFSSTLKTSSCQKSNQNEILWYQKIPNLPEVVNLVQDLLWKNLVLLIGFQLRSRRNLVS